MRRGFVTFLCVFAAAELSLLVLRVDRWPLTSYPMYANTRHYRSVVDHVGADENGRVAFVPHPLNSMMNGPTAAGELSPRDRGFVRELLRETCPAERRCGLYRTGFRREADGRLIYESKPLNLSD